MTCGADSEVSRAFQTRPIQWGNTAPDILPFNPAKFGNMDHPVIDWNGTAPATAFCDPLSTHSYCDPNTGVEYWPVTKPGWIAPTYYPAPVAGAWAGTPIQLSGSTWTNPTQVSYHAPSPTVFATATGGTTNKLFVPLSSFNCGAGQTLSGFAGVCTIDDMSITLWCGNATTGGVTGFSMQLSFDGGQTLVGNATTSSNCPTGAPAQQGIYPQANASPIFAGWGIIPQRNLIIPPAGTVSVSGTTVTLTTASPTGSNYFNLDWKPGTPILINGSYAHLAGTPSSSTTLTTVENLGTLTNVAYSGANAGVVIWKTNSSSASVDVAIGLNYSFSSPIYQGFERRRGDAQPSQCDGFQKRGRGNLRNLYRGMLSRRTEPAGDGLYRSDLCLGWREALSFCGFPQLRRLAARRDAAAQHINQASRKHPSERQWRYHLGGVAGSGFWSCLRRCERERALYYRSKRKAGLEADIQRILHRMRRLCGLSRLLRQCLFRLYSFR